MNNNLTELVFILDHSGSMQHLTSETIGGFNSLTEKEYYARGCTALLDAVGRTIDAVGRRLSETPEAERPGKVIFTITTDGQENASREYSLSKIKEMITHQ